MYSVHSGILAQSQAPRTVGWRFLVVVFLRFVFDACHATSMYRQVWPHLALPARFNVCMFARMYVFMRVGGGVDQR